MITAAVMTTSMMAFLGKMLACGLLGFALLAIIRIVIDTLMNPKGWKFGNELYDHHEDTFFTEESEGKMRLNYQKIHSSRHSGRDSRH